MAKLAAGDVSAGRYRIVAPLAAGGMGEVFEAQHLELGKAFALKVMLPGLAANAQFVKRFKIEAIAASRIGHPNIVDISDFDQTEEGRFFVVMELLDGVTLTELVKSEGALAPARAIRLALQVARALAAAHEQEIVHRDLKPDNVIVLDRPGNPELVKVLDFGVARVSTAPAEKLVEGPKPKTAGETAVGKVVGTPQYMSPEQAKGLVVDARSDIYALGLTLHELLSGAPAFSGNTPHSLMVKQVTEPPPPLPESVPAALRSAPAASGT